MLGYPFPAEKMSKRGAAARSAPEHVAQDGGEASKSAKEKYREAAQKLFSPNGTWDLHDVLGDGSGDRSGSQSDADDTVPLEDLSALVLPWDTVSNTPGSHTERVAISPGTAGPEHTLRDILSAVTSCNLSVTALAAEI